MGLVRTCHNCQRNYMCEVIDEKCPHCLQKELKRRKDASDRQREGIIKRVVLLEKQIAKYKKDYNLNNDELVQLSNALDVKNKVMK